MPSRLTRHVCTVLNRSPLSLRDLARAAGVDHSLLSRIRAGERTATADVAGRLAVALRTLSQTTAALAERLEKATSGHREVICRENQR
jgi:transcriptional regulator with XRE-family HTH domain